MGPRESTRQARTWIGPIASLDSSACTLVNDILRAISGGLPREILLPHVLDAAVEMGEAELAFLVLGGSDDRRIVAARSCDREDVINPNLKMLPSLIRRCHEDRVVVVVTDAAKDSRISSRQVYRSTRRGSLLLVPMTIEGEVMGSLYLMNRFRCFAFGVREVELVQGLMKLLAAIISGGDADSELRSAASSPAA